VRWHPSLSALLDIHASGGCVDVWLTGSGNVLVAASWLTEFSCPEHASPERQLAFMREIVPAFDAMPDIIPRYAWFVARGAGGAADPSDVLITGDDLNALGRYYNGSTT
jgi:hypothetical protein